MVFSESLNHNYEIVPPDPAIIMESLRSIGYSLETAIADIIDNSISAGAKNINFDTDSSGQYIMISDDGRGLTEKELVNALKLGSLDPLLKRSKGDLGRFGLGLKLASLSHCRKLTVASKTYESDISIRQWDLDYIRKIGDWGLIQPDINDYPRIKNKFNSLSHGTIVYWENIDRYIKGTGNTKTTDEVKWYGEQIRKVNNHLSMVFHRFLEEEDNFTITLPDGSLAKPWDPFLRNHLSTRPLPDETAIKGFAVYPYILPHKSRFSNDEEYKAATGPFDSWSRAQGFYVYRGKRLITAGSWLGLRGLTKSHDTDLVRIRLDILNDADDEWMLDIKKSSIKIPKKYQNHLETIAKNVRQKGRELRLSRGEFPRRVNPGDYKFLWDMNKNRKGEIRYRINRRHPFIENCMNSESPLTTNDIENILRMIEETVPTQGIILEEMKNPDSVPLPFDDVEDNELEVLLKGAINILNLENLANDEKRTRLLSMEPFSDHDKLISRLLSEEI